MIQHALQRIADDFEGARQQPLAGHPLADYLRNEAAQEIRDAISRPDLRVIGAPGQGNWAEIPWIGLFHPEVTTSATRGFYIVYLFAADMSVVNLCLGQGVTAVRDEFGDSTVDELLRRASLIRDRIAEFAPRFTPGPTELGGTTRLAIDYDAAVAFYKSYDLASLPEQSELITDIQTMVSLYDLLVGRGGLDNVEGATELGADQDQSSAYQTIEERRRYVRHNRIDRHSGAARLAKKVHGHICQGCGFDFNVVYGEFAENYIEAHHLTPLADLPEDQPVSLDPKTDFAVLCANCHRMVHKKKEALTIEQLKRLSGVKSLRDWFSK